MTAIALVIVLIALIAHTAGQIFLKHAMASSHTEAGFLARACVIPFAIGIALMTAQFFLNLGLLQRYDLSFIKLDGSIGCMVNGAGLAMATMDTIKYFGGEPANFLDVGGSATTEKVTAAFKIITADPSVHGIFVNIFGGIMKCDTIAAGVIAAVKQVGLKVPLVVRLEGTNVELGKKLLSESGLAVTSADDMADGAKKIVALAAKGNR